MNTTWIRDKKREKQTQREEWKEKQRRCTKIMSFLGWFFIESRPWVQREIKASKHERKTSVNNLFYKYFIQYFGQKHCQFVIFWLLFLLWQLFFTLTIFGLYLNSVYEHKMLWCNSVKNTFPHSCIICILQLFCWANYITDKSVLVQPEIKTNWKIRPNIESRVQIIKQPVLILSVLPNRPDRGA